MRCSRCWNGSLLLAGFLRPNTGISVRGPIGRVRQWNPHECEGREVKAMFTATTSSTRPKRLALSALALSAVLGIAGCSQSNPLEPAPGSTGDGETIVVGSQAYYSNEIIAELYAQVLEN